MRLLIVIDNYGWAIGNFAQDVKKFCGDAFEVVIASRRSLLRDRRVKADVALVPAIGLLPIPFPLKRTIVRVGSWTWRASSMHAQLVKKARMALCVNHALCREWAKASRRVVYFPNVVDLERFFPRSAPRDDVDTVFGIAGTLRRPDKGFKRVVQAFYLATKTSQEADRHLLLRFCGTGYKSSLLPRDAMRERFYHGLDAYVMASEHEGGPNTLVEAMACGVPCVATRTGLAPEIIRDGENGWLFDGSVEALKSIVLRLVNQRALLRAIGAAARKTAEELSWQRWHTLLRRIIKETAR